MITINKNKEANSAQKIPKLMTVILIGLGLLVTAACGKKEEVRERSEKMQLVVGTYSQKGSEGIYQVEFDPSTSSFSEVSLLAQQDNPSFLALADSQRLFAVNELDEGRLTTLVKQGSSWQQQATVATQGASPCYVALSPSGKFIATANYMGGSVSVFGLDDNGGVKGEAKLSRNFGSGPNKDRQEAAHAHWVEWAPGGEQVYSVDLGTDQILIYDFDASTGALSEPKTALKMAPGDGPRHLVFHPNLADKAYVLNELSNTVSVLRIEAEGLLSPIQRLPTLPEDFKQHSQAGHIYLSADGKNLYASNRGHNSIAVFAIDQSSGELSLLQIESTHGDWPRHFLILDRVKALLVANQESHDIQAFRVLEDGQLEYTGKQVDVVQPTFIGVL